LEESKRKTKFWPQKKKKTVAYHEAGHTIIGWFLPYADPVLKVSIVPRGKAALGMTQFMPRDQYLKLQEQILDELCLGLGGRIAEEIVLKKITSGAQDDLQRVTKMAYAIVRRYGMEPTIGHVSFGREEESMRMYSDQTTQLMDHAVQKIVQKAYDRTKKLMLEKEKELHLVAEILLQKEVINNEDLIKILGEKVKYPSVNPSTTPHLSLLNI